MKKERSVTLENLATIYGLLLNAFRVKTNLNCRNVYVSGMRRANRLLYMYAERWNFVNDKSDGRHDTLLSSQYSEATVVRIVRSQKNTYIVIGEGSIGVGFDRQLIWVDVGDKILFNAQGVFIRRKTIGTPGFPMIIALLFEKSPVTTKEEPLSIQTAVSEVETSNKTEVSHPTHCYVIATRSRKNPLPFGRSDGVLFAFSGKKKAQDFKSEFASVSADYIIRNFEWDTLVYSFASVFGLVAIDPTGTDTPFHQLLILEKDQ